MTAPDATLEPAVAASRSAAPGGVLAGMAVVSTVSAFVIGPAVTDGSESAAPSRSVSSQAVPDAAPSGASPSEHEAHHRWRRSS